MNSKIHAADTGPPCQKNSRRNESVHSVHAVHITDFVVPVPHHGETNDRVFHSLGQPCVTRRKRGELIMTRATETVLIQENTVTKLT